MAADGEPLALALDGSRVSSLVPGTNTLEITVTAEDGTTTAGYTVAVTRARSAADARREAAEERRKARDARRDDAEERSGTVADETRAISNEDAGGTCVVGLELSPGSPARIARPVRLPFSKGDVQVYQASHSARYSGPTSTSTESEPPGLTTSISGLTHFPNVRLRDGFGLLEQISRRRGQDRPEVPAHDPCSPAG